MHLSFVSGWKIGPGKLDTRVKLMEEQVIPLQVFKGTISAGSALFQRRFPS